MDRLFDQLLMDWEFSPAAPGLWSALAPIAPYVVACLSAISVWILARILLHRSVKERVWLRTGVGLFLFNVMYSVLVPPAGITQPITVRNIIGSSTLTLFLWCMSKLFFGFHHRGGHKEAQGGPA